MPLFDKEIKQTQDYFNSPRFKGIIRLYSARQVVEQRGTIRREYSIAKQMANNENITKPLNAATEVIGIIWRTHACVIF